MSSLLYLFRHGNAARKGVLIGQVDSPLTPLGERQFAHWRDELSSVPFSAAWTSPLLRARQSAAAVLLNNAGSVREAETIPELREISLGAWDGKEKEWIRRRYAQTWEERGRDMARVAPPGGESFLDLSLRALPAFKTLCRQAARHAHSLAIAHQAVNRVILCDVLGVPLARMREILQPEAVLNVLELAPDGMARLLEQRFAPDA